MRTTEEQHNERKREIMVRASRLWRQRVAVQREICIPISTVLMN